MAIASHRKPTMSSSSMNSRRGHFSRSGSFLRQTSTTFTAVSWNVKENPCHEKDGKSYLFVLVIGCKKWKAEESYPPCLCCIVGGSGRSYHCFRISASEKFLDFKKYIGIPCLQPFLHVAACSTKSSLNHTHQAHLFLFKPKL